MAFLKHLMNQRTYFFSLLLLLFAFFICVWFFFIPFENLLIYLNHFRPDKPYQFFTSKHHFYFRIFLALISFSIILLISLLQTKTKQYLELVKTLKKEILLLIDKTKAKTIQVLRTEDRPYLYLLFFVLSIGIITRLFYLDRPVFHDEAKTIYSFVSKSWVDTISNYYVPNNHVFHSVLSRICYLVFGNEEWVFRLPVFFSGCCTLVLCYLYARSFFNKHIAIILLALITNGIPLVSYSVNARGYILITVCFLLLLLVIKELSKDKGNTVLYIFFVLVSSIGLWTAPVMAMSLFFVFYWFLLDGGRQKLFYRLKRSFVALLFIGSTTFLLYSPIIVRCGINALTSNPYVKEQTFKTILEKLPSYLLLYWNFLTAGYSPSIKYVLVCLFVLGVLYHASSKHSRNLFFSLILSAFSIFFILKRLPFDRTILFVYPLFWSFNATGAYYILKFISKKTGQGIKTLCFYFSVIAFFYSSILCIKNKGIIKSYQNQTCVEAEIIVEDIQKHLKKGNKIETSTPLAGPIRYYLLKKDLDEEILHWHHKGKDKGPLLNSNKVYIITRNGRNSLSSYGYNDSFSVIGFSKPKLWRQYQNTVEVYVIEKLL